MCKLGFCHLNLTGTANFKYERKNEMNSCLSSKNASSFKWPIGKRFEVPFAFLVNVLISLLSENYWFVEA